MTAYYNEYDKFAAQWLRELIKAGHIAPGYVDERSIEDVTANDLKGFTQCHFFAGIGVWSYALRQAGWPDNRPVWTGSCPCQPFSSAGKRAGLADERHLWPAWYHLIGQHKPTVVFGEQVASKDGLGWLDLVQTDLEASGYAFAANDLCAAGFGGPHIRQRLFFVANAYHQRSQGGVSRWQDSGRQSIDGYAGRCSAISGLADDQSKRRDGGENSAGITGRSIAETNNTIITPGPVNGYWSNADWLSCRDGKWRPVEPGTFPLVNGAAARVGRLRGYGNAIVAEVATQFIKAYLAGAAA